MSYTTERNLKNLISDETIQNLICFNKVEDFFESFNQIILSSYFVTSHQYYDLYNHIYKLYHSNEELPFDEEYFDKLYKEYQRCILKRKERVCNFDGCLL